MCLAWASAPADAASKIAVAALGDPAPGGGVFAAPGLAGWPAAAGDGWVAFRGRADGEDDEAIVAVRATAPAVRVEVARLGGPAPGGGRFERLLGRPAVNASGDVAFLALLAAGDVAGPPQAAVFLHRAGQLRAVARSGDTTSAGTLDLLGTFTSAADGGVADTATCGPALNDAGDVAFVASLDEDDATALFLAPATGGLVPRVRTGQAFDGGRFVHLGPPALNGHGTLAFHGRIVGHDGVVADGVLTAADDGEVVFRVRGRTVRPLPLDQFLTEFTDAVALDDDGNIAFLAGPLSDPSGTIGEEGPGVLLYTGGVVLLLAYPGQEIGTDRVAGFALGPAGGGVLPAPALAPDGSVLFVASFDDGGEAILRATPGGVDPVVRTAGAAAGPTPAGGHFAGATSGPAVDAAGGVAFAARAVGAMAPEIVVHRPGGLPAVVVGRPSAAAAGPFSAAALDDEGDVAFHAFVAGAESAAGIFRARGGRLEALVRAGDPAPVPGAAPFLEFVGGPGLGPGGAVAFAARVAGRGRGVFVADGGRVQALVARGDPAPGAAGSVFVTFAPDPDVNDDGAIAFRAETLVPGAAPASRREGLFVADASGVRALVYAGDASPARATPYLALQDPALLPTAPAVAFHAPLGTARAAASGLFLAAPGGTSPIAVERDALGGGVVLTGFLGRPAVGPDGEVAFLATRARPIEAGGAALRDLGPAILLGTDAGLELIAARDMPGPGGGSFRTLGAPVIGAARHVAFHGTFLPGTGGTPGVFLATAAGVVPYVLAGEHAPGGGRLDAVAADLAANARDEIAFVASVTGGRSAQGVFLASPTTLDARAVRLGRRRTRIHLRLRLGPRSDGVHPAAEPVTLSLADAAGTLWSADLPPGTLARRGRVFAARPRRDGLRALALRVRRGGRVDLHARLAGLGLTQGGAGPLAPPLMLRLEVGDDAGTATVVCSPHGGRARCPRR